ncbi:MAG: aldehyde ferredoxin oxidoreductase family protein [Thermodesulfobacteriota bacterium]
MSSYQGKFLSINLSKKTYQVEKIPDEVKRDWIGGRGFGIRYLYEELRPGIDPLGPENKLLFLTGVLSGTTAQGFSRYVVMGKSPSTGCVGRSVGGGNFGAQIKFAGYDFLTIEGTSDKPTYLYIDQEGVKFFDASELWGLDTQLTQERIKKIHGEGTQVACIGPAGEKLVRFATITHGRRTASRCGMGTVMGSKRIKAIVIQAKGKVVPENPEAFKEAVEKQISILKTHPRRIRMTDYGTTTLVEVADRLGCFPTRNFQAGRMEGIEKLVPEEFSKIKLKNFGCFSCMTRCGQVHQVKEGSFKGSYSEGPEYETIWAFSGQVGNNDLGAIVAADSLCDHLGIDTISTGNAIGFVMELFEKGIITPKEADGLDLRWGNVQSILTLVEKIGRREGFGRLLGEGVKRASEEIGRGAQYYAMHAKGLELPAYEPRSIKGYGLSYATSNIGGSHMYGRPRQELYGTAEPRLVDRLADEGKGDIIALVQKQQASEEVVVICTFGNSGLTSSLLGDLLASASGYEEFRDPAYVEKVGERIVCLERCFNVREGFGRKEDTLPQRMFREPLLNAGEATGQMIRKMDTLLDEYYEAFGYNKEGIPTSQRITELGLKKFLEDHPF